MKNKKFLVIGLVVALVLAAILVGVLVFGRGEDPQPTEPTNSAAEETPGDQTDGTEDIGEATGGNEATGDPTEGTEATDDGQTEGTDGATEPAETEPDATEPAETEPGETEPAVTEPQETEPEATEPAETEPEETVHVHNFVVEHVPPTCTEIGYTDTTCECGYFEGIGHAALGHDWSEWVITVEPTVDTVGERQRTCSRCGTVTEVIPKLDPETGEMYESYIDPRIEVKKYRTGIAYNYADISVSDFRTWGDPPSIWVNEDGSLTVAYFQQDGTKVEVIVEVPEEGYIGECRILPDGTYLLTRTGSYAN